MEHCVCCLVASFFSSSVGHKVCVSVSKVFANPVCIGCLCFSGKGFVVAPLCVCVRAVDSVSIRAASSGLFGKMKP